MYEWSDSDSTIQPWSWLLATREEKKKKKNSLPGPVLSLKQALLWLVTGRRVFVDKIGHMKDRGNFPRLVIYSFQSEHFPPPYSFTSRFSPPHYVW